MHSAKILPLPATPPIAAIRLRSLAEPVPPRYRYSPYRTWFLATPVAPILALQPRSLPQFPPPRAGPSASQSAAASALPAPCVSQLPRPVSSLWPHGCRSFRALSRLVGLQLPRLARRYRDSCVVAGAGNVQRPFVGVG